MSIREYNMKKDLNDLKKVVHDILQRQGITLPNIPTSDLQNLERLYNLEHELPVISNNPSLTIHNPTIVKDNHDGFTGLI